MSPRTRWLILGLALVGLAFAGSSAWVHYRLIVDPTYVSPCDINATFNCSQVYLSPYGSVWGVPVALGGVIWFALVALLAGLGRPDAEGRSPIGGYLFAVATIGLAVILYLGYASFFTLRTGCLLCMGTYVCVVGIFLATGLSRNASVSGLPGRLAGDLRSVFSHPVTLVTALLYVVGAASLIAFFPKEGASRAAAVVPPAASDAEAFSRAWNAQPRVDLGVPADGAAVTVVKFVDWQCPSCKAAYYAYKPVLDKYIAAHPGAIREVIKDYPLNGKCNYFINGVGHPAACEAAVAMRLARDRGKAQEFLDWIFTAPAQTAIEADAVKAQIRQILGDPSLDFDKEYAARIDAVQRDVADAGALQINSTPTYFVNGVRAQTATGWLPPQYFDLAIKLELEKAGVQ
ncbi:MAG: vitamin K epoxide reductase family protein [Vicinamibacterales bacterium]